MQPLASLLSLAALAALATAQSTLVIPNGTATTEGSGGNAFPWGRGPNGIRIQNLYDGANFTNQGVTAPIVVSRLRWRANTNTLSLATSYATGATVKLSTSPVDQAAISTTLSNNQGSDLTTVFTGPVSWPAAAATAGPCPFLIDIPLSAPFYYDPARGDLNIETDLPIQTFTGTMLQIDHHNTVASPASRAFVTTGYTNGGANDVGTVGLNTGAVVEVTYTQATGLHPRFTANVTRGPSPLAVTFTDQTWTSAPGGVTSWAWDFNGDSVIDSTLQNPTFVYTGCGDFPVTLTVDDGVNGPVTWTAPNFIRTDELVADFTFAQLIAPDTWQFTDATTPTANAWLWDFNGDNIVDSTLQNPTWVMPICQLTNVRLDAYLNCRTSAKTKAVYAAPATLPTTFVSTGQALSGQGFLFDLAVSHTQGVNIWGLDTVISSSPASFTANLYVTPGSHVGNDTNAAVWRLAGTATGTYTAVGPTLTQFSSPVHLPAGNYGAALYFSASTFARFQGNPPQTTFGNSDLTFTNGPMKSTLFGGTTVLGRLWPGAIHYDTATLGATAGHGFFGAGCPGALGITHLQHTSRPQLGTTLSINLDNLPLAAAIMMVGFSKTVSQSGPLPLDLGSFGAPGCFARVSPDATQFLLGAGSTATWTFGVPNDAGFLGMPLFHQALVLDQPASNSLGAVVSDAAGILIGH